jgi:nitronate monooxygenase
MGITEKHWKETKKIDFGSESDTLSEEAKAWKTIWSAGQGVSAINDSLRVTELVRKLKTEFIAAIQSQQKLLKQYQ